ncbi:polysaccharide deacetylase family protein [Elusimicrobiota bacterium]
MILTFDDGPHPGITEKIIEVLKEHDVPATFFLVGIMMRRYPYLVKKIHENGFEIGNHTYSDIRLTTLTTEDIKKALDSVNDLLEAIIGKKTIFFRPPGGRYDDKVLDIAHEMGFYTVLWTRHVSDTSDNITVEKIIDRATSSPQNTELIMMHDGPEETIVALPKIIEFYKERGYKFTTVSKGTPPMFQNMTTKYVTQDNMHKQLWTTTIPLHNDVNEQIPGSFIATIVVIAFLSGSIYFVKASNKKDRSLKISLVFIDFSSVFIEKIADILNKNNIAATFFIPLDKMGEVNGISGLDDHNLAILGRNGANKDIMGSLSEWKDHLKFLHSSVLPFYYAQSGYEKKDVEKIKENGLIPVDWRIELYDKSESSLEDLRVYLRKKLKDHSIVPLRGDRKQTVDALGGLIKEFVSKGYSFLSLEEYLMRKFDVV